MPRFRGNVVDSGVSLSASGSRTRARVVRANRGSARARRTPRQRESPPASCKRASPRALRMGVPTLRSRCWFPANSSSRSWLTCGFPATLPPIRAGLTRPDFHSGVRRQARGRPHRRDQAEPASRSASLPTGNPAGSLPDNWKSSWGTYTVPTCTACGGTGGGMGLEERVHGEPTAFRLFGLGLALTLDSRHETTPGIGAHGESRSLAVLGVPDLNPAGRDADLNALGL